MLAVNYTNLRDNIKSYHMTTNRIVVTSVNRGELLGKELLKVFRGGLKYENEE